jgi:beta-1,4-mannosyl-glycoprotein beta-1,4-N-acetylglucosaminyltransferase
MFSDPDEIPNPIKLHNLNLKKKYAIFLQKLFYYKLNLQDEKLGCNWEGTRVCRKKDLKSIDYMRQKVLKKNSKYGFWRIDKEKNFEVINEGGWHFSYLLTAEEIQRKIKTFAHTELDQEKFTSLKNINESIQKGSDVFHRQVNYKKVEIDYSYPEYIIKNKMLLTDWIC